MPLITAADRAKLLSNGALQQTRRGTEAEIDFAPVVKLFTPDAAATWLLTELDPDDPDLAFGLCDLGLGSPELGYVRISEVERVRGRFGLRAERDRHFRPTQSIRAYADQARERGYLRA